MSIERELRGNWDNVYYPEPEPMVEQAMAPGQQPGDVLVAEAGSRGLPESAYSGEPPKYPRMEAYDPTTREKLSNKMQTWLESMGVDRYKARQNAQTFMGGGSSNLPLTMGIADIIPYIGTGMQTEEAIRLGSDAITSAQQGNYGTAAVQAGGAALGLIPGAVGTGQVTKKLLPKAGEMVIKSMEKLGTPVQMNLIENAPSMGGAATREITRQEKSAITAAAKRNPVLKESATTAVDDFHNNYSVDAGWAPVEVNKITFKTNKTGEKIPEIETNAIPYDFHTPPKGVPKEAWQATLSSRIVDEVSSVVDRAKSGDQAALDIIAEAGWYRTMRDRLRSEFGGIGDVFADVLGTTSAQTDVRQNFKNAVAILNKFSRGDYDNALAAYESRVNTGKSIDPGTLNKLYQSGDFDLIKSDAGALFNTNSPASMGALLDMFRAVKAGDSPKTPNFTGNLIGLTNEATIDVWAARLLRRMADLPRIPPPAEKGVAGKHLKGSTLYQPNVGSEFGFGQDVFREAASEINSSGIVKGVDPQVGNLGPDDLQAIAWFIEKENWTKNGWTTKAGEGGSLDYEMSLAGSPDQTRIGELRQGINAGFQPPPMRVGENVKCVIRCHKIKILLVHLCHHLLVHLPILEDLIKLDKLILQTRLLCAKSLSL